MIIFGANHPRVLDGTYDREGYKPGERALIDKARARRQHEEAHAMSTDQSFEWRPTEAIAPSPLNPRRAIDLGKLEELAASIRAKGIIEPLIVRRMAGAKTNGGKPEERFEIVAGERRWRAARLAGEQKLPVIVRTLTDVELLELMAIENSQRDDLHPLEEADGFLALLKADGAYTPSAIAAKIGKSPRYVDRRLKLAQLIPKAKTSFLDNHITAGHAEVLSRLGPEHQAQALTACFDHLYGDDLARGCISINSLSRWVSDHVRLQLETKNPEIETFPELGKLLEHTKAESVLQVHRQYGQTVKGALPPDAYLIVEGKKGRCTHTERAVVVLGTERGQLVDICRTPTCPKHHPAAPRGTAVAPAPRKSSADQARDRRQREWRAVKAVAIEEAGKRGAHLSPGVLQVLAWGILHFHYNGKAMSLRDVVKAAAERAAGEQESTFVSRIAKPLGIDMGKLHKSATLAPVLKKKGRR